jgi:isopenicillin N synthase-like dioxygenase
VPKLLVTYGIEYMFLKHAQKLGACGMQVKTKDGKWIWVQPIQGTFVVNIGDMLMVCNHPSCPLISV